MNPLLLCLLLLVLPLSTALYASATAVVTHCVSVLVDLYVDAITFCRWANFVVERELWRIASFCAYYMSIYYFGYTTNFNMRSLKKTYQIIPTYSVVVCLCGDNT